MSAVAAWLAARLHHWVDPATIAVACIFILFLWYRATPRHRLLDRRTAADAFTGITIFPLLLLIGSSISHYIAGQFLATNHVLLFAVGVLALISVLTTNDPKT